MNYQEIITEYNRNAPSYEVIEMSLEAINNTKNKEEQSNLLLLIGRCYKNLKQYLKADRYFNKALEKFPNPVVYYWKGFLKYDIKKDEEALELYTKAISLAPNYYKSFLQRGIIHYFYKRYQEALQDLQQANSLNEKDKLVHNFLANTLYIVGNKTEAELHFRAACKLGDTLSASSLKEFFSIDNYEEEMNLSRHYWSKKLDAECFASIEKAITMEIPDNETKSKLHKEAGYKYFVVNNLDKALYHLDTAIALDSTNARALACKASILYVQNREGDLSSSAAYFKKAIALDPNCALFYYDYCFVPMQQKDTNKTLELLHKSYELYPYSANTAYYLGFVYSLIENKEKAIEYLVRADFLGHQKSKALRKEKYGNTVALDYFNDGMTLSQNQQYQLAIDNYEKAISLYEKQMKFKGDLSYITITTAYSNMGICYANLRSNKAEGYFMKAIQRDPLDIHATNNLGNYYLEDKKEEKALEFFARVKELNPDFSMAYYNTGRIFLNHTKEYQKAIEEFSAAINLSPNNLNLQKEAYYRRGKCYEALHQYQDAYDNYTKSGDVFEASQMMAILKP